MSLGLEPVSRTSLSDAVFDQLAGQILAERIAPGEALPPERDLSKALGVNRGAIREALKRLAQAGLVQQRHGGGTTVLDYRRSAGLDLLSRLLISPAGEPDLHVVRSIMEMRAALAPDIARLCALRSGPALHRELEATLAQIRAAASDLDQLQTLSLELWELLVTGADNIAYRLAFNTLRETYEQIREALVIALSAELGAIDRCAALVTAVIAGEGEAARRQATALVALGSEGLLAAIELYGQLDDGRPTPKTQEQPT